jgi:3-hydroxyacyl-CoA dehydrogenase
VKVGIIGGGMIGAGWARLLRQHGHTVAVHDEQPDRSETTLAAAVAGADLVIEAVVEVEYVKRAILAQAAQHAPAEALLASSSSGILPSRLQEGLPRPERVLVLHPLHPVELLPVVEVVPGARTAPEAVIRAAVLLRNLGKVPVILKREAPGYIVNRLAAALWREAINLVLEGVADPETVDIAASRGPCLGWAIQGPFLTYQLAAPGGLGTFMTHLHPAFQAIWASLADWEAVPPGGLERLAEMAAKVYGGREAEYARQRDRALTAVLNQLSDDGSSFDSISPHS